MSERNVKKLINIEGQRFADFPDNQQHGVTFKKSNYEERVPSMFPAMASSSQKVESITRGVL